MIKRFLLILLPLLFLSNELLGQCGGATVSLGSDQFYCNGTNVTLNATVTNTPPGSPTYNWTFQGQPITPNPGSSFTIPANQSGTYAVSINYGPGCTLTDDVVVGFLPVPTITPSQCISNGSTANLSVNFSPSSPSTVTYSWTGPNSFTSNSANPTISSFNASKAGTYNVTVSFNPTSGPPCTYTLSTILNLTPTTPSFSIPTNGCLGTNYSPTAFTSQPNVSYSWSVSPSSNSSGLSSATPTFNFTNAGTYSVSVTATQNGCSSTSSSQNISIPNFSLAAPTIQANSNYYNVTTANPNTIAICAGSNLSSVTIINNSTVTNGGTNPIGTTYTYSLNGSVASSIIDNASQTINYGNNNLILTANYLGCTITGTYNIYSGSNPYVLFGTGNSTGICPGNSISFDINPINPSGQLNPPGTTYTVTFSDTPGTSTVLTDITTLTSVNHTFNTTSCGAINPSTFPANTFYAQVVVQNFCGQTNPSVSPITVNNFPTANFTVTDSTICTGQSITITNTGTAGTIVGNAPPYNCSNQGKFYWVISGGTSGVDYNLVSGVLGNYNSSYTLPNGNPNTAGNGSNTLEITFINPGYYTITQYYYNSCGIKSKVRNICVISPPTCQFSVNPNSGCSPLSVNINNTTIAPSCSGSPIPLTYAWTVTSPTGTTSSYTSNSSQIPPALTLTNPTTTPQTFTITLVVSPKDPYAPTQNFGNPNCTSTCTQTVTVNPIPAFTPFNITSCTSPYLANVNLQANTNMTSSFTWIATSNTNVSGESLNNQNSSILNDNLVNQSTNYQTINYSITPTSILGCLGATQPSTITINTISAGTISSDQTICSSGDPANLTGTTPNGFGTLSYQWQSSTDNTNWTNITNATNPNFDPPPTATTIYYRRVVTYLSNGVSCSSNSNIVTITVNSVNPGTIGLPQNICAGDDPIALSVVNLATASGTLSYAWQSSTTSASSGFSNISNQTGTSYDPPILTSTTWYQLNVTSTLNGITCSQNTPAITISVFSLNSGVVGSNQNICEGGDPSNITETTPSSSSTGTLSYQWQSSVDNISWSNISGATGTTYNPPILNATTYYRRIVYVYSGSTLICQGYSNVITISVIPDPTFSAQPTPSQTICEGGSVSGLTATISGGSGTPSYQWYTVNGSTYTQITTSGTSATYTPPTFTTSGTFNYALLVTQSVSGCASTYSANATVIVVADPSVTPPVGASYCQNASPVTPLSVTASNGNGTGYTYLWYSNTTNSNSGGTPQANSNSPTFTPPVNGTGTLYYYCLVTSSPTNSGCSTPSATATITVTAGPSFTTQPQSQTICVGGTLSALSVAYSGGSGTPSYQWYSNTTAANTGGTALNGETNATLNLPSGLNNTAATSYYYCVINFGSGSGCSVITSSVATILVLADPTFSAQPTPSQTICEGGSVSGLTATISGGSGTPSYQWYTVNGTTYTPITTNGTSATYSPPTYGAGSAGTYNYALLITQSVSGCASSYSANATVIVVADPTVTQPVGASYCQNASPVTPLTVTASGGGSNNYSYQWFNGTNAINGATNSSFIPPVASTGTINYTCQITISPSTSGCSVTSNAAAITVTAGPAFTTQPQSQTICVGGTLSTLSVAYSGGSGTPNYQWYSNTTAANTGGTALNGETNATLNLPSGLNNTAATSYYYCVINFGSGSGCSVITSNAATISVLADPIFSVQPTPSQTICEGGSVSGLTATISGGSGTPSYQWYTVNGTTYTPITTNGTSASYTPPTFTTVGTFNYALLVTQSVSGCASTYSANATVIVVADPTVTPPVGASYCQDASPVTPLTVTASNGNGSAYTYQWFSNSTNSNSGGTPQTNSNNASFTPPVNGTGTTYYYCLVTSGPANSGCSTSSATATITVNSAPTFASQPLATQTVCLDGTFSALTVTTQNGTGTPTFQWYSNTTSSTSGGTAISGATSASYTPPATSVGTTYYYCVATFASGGCSNITSALAAAIVVADPTISIQPLPSQSICVGGNIATPLTVTASGGTGSYSYQWSTAAGQIPGAINQNYTPTAFTTVGQFTYTVSVSQSGSGCNAMTSQSAMIEVVADPIINTQPITAAYCQNASPVAPLTVSATGGTSSSYSYQWYNGATPIGSATSSSYTPSVANTGTINYTCEISLLPISSGCSVTSTAATITVNTAPTFATHPLVTQTVCLDGTFSALTVTTQNGTGTPTFQWLSNTSSSTSGGTLISGATSASFTPPATSVGTTYYYCVATFASGGCSNITSALATAIVVADPLISAQPIAAQSICVGGTIGAPITVTATGGTGTYSYQWSNAAGAITGATNQNFTPPTFTTVGQNNFTVTITQSGSGCNALTSQNALIEVVADPIVSTQPINAAYCQNASPVAPLSISATGGIGTFSYQWYSNTANNNTNGSLIPGATSSTFIPSVATVGTNYYYCVITQTGLNCGVTSNTAEIIVNLAPTFATQPLVTQTVCLDGTFSALTVTTQNGTGTPTFQWFSNTTSSPSGGTPISGATSASYTPPGTTVGTTYYYCVATYATGGCTAITSALATAIVVVDPTISIQPIPAQSICVGGNIANALTVTAIGGTGTTSYQWNTSAGPISGATNQSYNPPPFNTVGAFTYNVTITLSGNGCNVVASQNAIVDVIADPVVSIQPISASYCQNGSPVTPLSVSATGGLGTFSYQWYSNSINSNSGGTIILGATSSSYTPSVATVGVKYYYCVLTQTGLNCGVTSNTASITVSLAPTFVLQPISQTICTGGSFAPISVTYQDGTGVPSYQWFSNSTNSYSGAVAITGAINSTFQPSAANLGTIYYFCEISFSFGGCSSISSNISNQTVVADPIISVEPQVTQSICVGGTIPAALSVTVTGGTGAITYQWFAGTNQVSGATQSTFLPSNFNTPGTFLFTANISIAGVGCNALISQPAQVIVVDDPSVSQPIAAVYCQNASPITPLQVNVTGGLGNNSYQWYFSSANTTSGGTAIVGANTQSYLPSVATVGTAYYYCIVNQSAPNCATTSANASIQVNIPPTISSQPLATQTLCEGGTPTLLQVAYINGTNSATYQWYTNNTNSNIGGTPISNATTASYNPQSTLLGTSYYYCVITFQQGGCSSLTTIAAQVTIVGDPAITTQPLANQEICQGNTINSPLTFNYTGGTGTSTITWYLDANPPVVINGISTNTYLPIPFNIADTFNYYATLSYSGVGCNTVSTQLAEIIVHPTPYVTNLDDTLIVCNHGNLSIPLTASAASTFSWQTQNTISVTGESFLPQTSYTIDDSLTNNTTTPQFLTYSVTPTSFPYGCVGPDSTVVIQLQPDVILSMSPSLEICSGSPVNGILTSNIPSTFNWFVSIDNPNVTGESIIPGTSWLINDVLVNNSNINQIVVYSVFPVSIQGQCPGAAQPLVVTVKPPIDLLNPDTLTICSGQNVGINLVANTNVNFNWYASPSLNVSGETTTVISSPIINDVLVNPTNAVEVVTYNVIGTSTANGCSSPIIPLFVVVNPIPSLVNLNPLTICNGNYLYPYSLQTSVVGSTTNWSVLNNPIGIPSTFGSNTLPGFIASNNTIITQTGQIQITPIYTNNNVTCMGNDTTLLIPVLPTPSVNQIADITACNLSQIPLTPVNGPVPNTIFEWYNANVSLGLNASGIGNIPTFVGLNNSTLPVSGTVTVAPSYTQNNVTCQGNPVDFEITINPSPTILNSNIEICDGEFTNILLNANIPSTFQWNANIQANVYNETAAPIQNSAFINDQLVLASTTPQTVTYNVTPISAPYGCIGFDTTILVQVNPLPIVDFTIITPILCNQSQINFQNNSVGSLDFTWTFGDGDSSFLFNPVHEYDTFGSYLVTLEAVDQLTGCFNDADQSIVIHQSPNADFILSDTLGCGSLDVTFNALDLNPNWAYLWNFGDGATSNQYGLAGHQFVTNGCFDINLQISTPEGCVSDTTLLDALCIYPEPIAAFTMDDPIVSSLTPEVQFFNSSLYADSYLWEFSDGTTSQTENPNHLFPSDPATYVIVLTASNNVGCQDTAALSVTIWQDLAIYVPNTFTPDGDEYNQTFKPVLTEGFKKDSYHMTIFNRWGEIVFESKDLEYGWDGRFGKPDNTFNPVALKCQDGTYTWKIEVTELQSGEVRKFIGHVNLIR